MADVKASAAAAAPTPAETSVATPAAATPTPAKADEKEKNSAVEYPPLTSFDDMELDDQLLRGVYAVGYERPPAIQQRAIMPITKGHDVIAQAQSGTGKTATFTIGLLKKIDTSVKKTQSLILAPTRELARQISGTVGSIGQFMSVTHHVCIGGTQITADVNRLNQGPHAVIGTPGRVVDMIERQVLKVNDVKIFILDEADQMLSGEFADRVYQIFQYLPTTVQVVLMSATMPPAVLDLTEKFMINPVRILVNADQLTLEGIRQFYIKLDNPAWKIDTICDLYESLEITQSVIFCNTRTEASRLTNVLTEKHFVVSCLHSDLNQADRDKVMREFTSGSSRVLIATDIIARGIDVQQVSVVINYDLPKECETYLHRIGRGGRFGRKGLAINLVTENSFEALENIRRFFSTEITEMPDDFATYLS